MWKLLSIPFWAFSISDRTICSDLSSIRHLYLLRSCVSGHVESYNECLYFFVHFTQTHFLIGYLSFIRYCQYFRHGACFVLDFQQLLWLLHQHYLSTGCSHSLEQTKTRKRFPQRVFCVWRWTYIYIQFTSCSSPTRSTFQYWLWATVCLKSVVDENGLLDIKLAYRYGAQGWWRYSHRIESLLFYLWRKNCHVFFNTSM